MAIYGRNKERWNPRKIKSKASKNRTYEIKTDSNNRHVLTDTLFYRLFMDEDDNVEILVPEREVRNSTDAYHLLGYRNQAITKYPSGWNPPSVDIDVSRFGKAINFGTSANSSNTAQNLYNMIAQQAPTEWTLDQLFGDSGTYSQAGARQIYFSFWFRRDTQNASNDGHTFAMLAYDGNSGLNLPTSTDPRISFYCNSTGQMHMRFADEGNGGSGSPGDKFLTIDGTPAFLQCGSDSLRVGIGTWHYVTFAVKLTSGWDVDEIVDNTMIFIDGVRDTDPQTPVKRNKTAFTVGLPEDAIWEWNFGSLVNCYGAYDSGDQTLRRSSGFNGALGEFTVITNSGSSDAERINFAKFLYEASREGVHALHSGIHSSSPRLEQMDLDRDSAYPSNFTMNSYTKFSDSLQYASDRDPRVGLQPSDAFREGALTDASLSHNGTVETWYENAGKYHIQSTVTSGTESVAVMPHLRLNPADTILTNGNWYSDARSEFFAEDLNPTTGFVVSNTNDAASTKHVPIVSDELYREHVSSDLPAFVESDMGEEFKDCFVIEIPLPHTGGALKLSTDAENIDGSSEIAMRRFNSSGPSGSTVNPNQKINTMAYYNFKDKKWEHTVPSYTTYAPDGQAGGLQWIGTGDIGFSPMSGLVFPRHGKFLNHFASLYGKPMTDCGFPFHKKFQSEEGQTIDLSKYLDEAVILEGWEIHCDAIPSVGYSHNTTNGAASNGDEDGYHEVYGSDFNDASQSKSPLYYGATGEAAVFWNPDGGETIPFYQKGFGSGGTQFRFDNTIPISSFSSTYVTGSDGSITETKTENEPTKTTKGLVTKGVTAFLLKESSLFNERNQREKWLRSQPRLIAGNANDLGSDSSYTYARTGALSGALQDWNGVPDSSIDQITESSTFGQIFPPISFEFYQPTKNALHPDGTSRELIGYLQQLYHNDPSGSLGREYYTRKDGSNVADGIVPNWRTTKPIVELLDKENDTYVSGLLRQNTDIYPLSLSGSCKIQTPYAGSFPISNFKIAGSAGTELGVYKHHTTTSNIDIYHSYAVIPSSEGSTFSEFVQHDTTPNIQGKDKAVSLSIPEAVYPSGAPQSGSYAASWKEAALSPFDVSVPRNEECDVVLRPSDKLILGIQDSVSTCFASQQIQHNASGAEFVRWGRNTLEIPDSTSGYLRLFVRRTRNDKTYNAVADESTYNSNVSRDLGDHLIDDDYMVNPPLMYSGSMADDIVGPSYFTPPIIKQRMAKDTNIQNQKVFDYLKSGASLSAILATFYAQQRTSAGAIEYYFDTIYPGLTGQTSRDLQVSDFKMPWSSLSARAFDNTRVGSYQQPAVPMLGPLSNSDIPNNYIVDSICGSFQSVIMHPRNVIGMSNSVADWSAPTYSEGFKRHGAGFTSVIEELDDRDTPFNSWSAYTYKNESGSTITANWNGNQITQIGNAASAWYVRLNFLIFQSNTSVYEPAFNTLQVDFRYVRIGTYNSNSYGSNLGWWADKYPEFYGGEEMNLGDAFYFDETGKARKLKTFEEIQAQPGVEFPNDKWARKWQSTKANSGGQTIYIVAAKGPMKISSYGTTPAFPIEASTETYTFGNLFERIANVLKAQALIDDGILFSDVKSNTDTDFLEIRYPDDPVIRHALSKQTTVDAINQANVFRLSGKDVVGSGTPDDFLYLIGHSSDSSQWFADPIPSSLDSAGWRRQWLPSGTSSGGTTSLRSDPSTKFMKNYIRTQTPYDVFGTGLASSNYVDIPDYPTGYNPAVGKNLEIDYVNLGVPTSNITISVEKETFTSNAKHIDRKISFRTTENTAGPFGSLNQFKKLNGSVAILDSLPPKLDILKADSLDLTTHGFTQNWLAEETSEKMEKVVLESVNTRTAHGSAAAFASAFTQDGFPIVETSLVIDGEDDVWAPAQASNGSPDWPDTFSNGIFPVTNYIQRSFSRLQDTLATKTASDLILGFGNGLIGRHKIIPSSFKYKAFQSYDGSSYDTSEPVSLVVETIIEEPRGSRFGLYNTTPMVGGYVYSYNSFGQMRDMLEQSIDTKFVNHAQNERVYGSPVVVSPVNPINPDVPKLMENTSRYNKTANAIVKKPFIESNYEATPNPVNLQSETLRVDVAGSVRTRSVTAPGNIAANIRSRG